MHRELNVVIAPFCCPLWVSRDAMACYTFVSYKKKKLLTKTYNHENHKNFVLGV